jgi:NADPH-dependent F420 reductase
LAARLADAGHEVVLGSRALERAEEVRDSLLAQWPERSLPLSAADNEGAAAADVVVVATPWDGAAPTVAGLADQLAGKVVICMANALTRVGKEFQPLIPPRGSVAADVQAAIPRSQVVAAFHHVPAKELAQLDEPLDCDVLVCSDHPDATALASGLTAEIPGARAVDAGRLSAAGPIESLTAVLIGMNVRYRSRLSIRITGLPEAEA